MLTDEQRKSIEWAEAVAAWFEKDAPSIKQHGEVFRAMLAASAPTLGEIDWREKFFAEQRARMGLEAALHLVVGDEPQPQAAEPKGLTDGQLRDLYKLAWVNRPVEGFIEEARALLAKGE